MTTVVVVGIGAVAGVAFHMGQQGGARKGNTESMAGLPPSRNTEITQPAETAAPTPRRLRPIRAEAGKSDQGSDASHGASAPTPALLENRFDGAGTVLFNQAIDSLVSPNAGYAQKQEAWKQLRESGKLDQAIIELEQRMTSNSRSAEHPAALGQAYLQKAGTIQDVREQGILAMKADQVFDAALNLDPSNWEARFTKAVAMSYWPTQMNKGTEVMQHFVTLVEQQEVQAPQPQFAQTYLWLGNEYEKYGYAVEAKEMWQRGATLFPDDQQLRTKLLGR